MLLNHMNEPNDSKVYEISYILVPSLPAEKVGTEVSTLAAILGHHSAAVIAEEAPMLISLAYEMDKSSGGGTHQRFTEGYFGWMKFSLPSSAIEEVRKAFEANPSVLRSLALSTVREKTYLGKRAKSESKAEDKPARMTEGTAAPAVEAPAVIPAPLSPAEIANVDKSIDEMVKGA